MFERSPFGARNVAVPHPVKVTIAFPTTASVKLMDSVPEVGKLQAGLAQRTTFKEISAVVKSELW